MVVPFPDHARRTLDAVIHGHRQLLRMTAEDARSRTRPSPSFAPARYAPRLATMPASVGLKLATPKIHIAIPSRRMAQPLI